MTAKKTPAKPATAPAVATADVVSQIRKVLADTLAHVPEIDDVAEGAALWVACKQIGSDLQIIRKDVEHRIVDLSPTRIIQKGKPGEREVPVKDQHIDGVGTVTITNVGVKTWADPVEMMHNILEWWPTAHYGEILSGQQVVTLMAALFPLGNVRVTALREIPHLAERYEQEPWLTQSYKDEVAVSVT